MALFSNNAGSRRSRADCSSGGRRDTCYCVAKYQDGTIRLFRDWKPDLDSNNMWNTLNFEVQLYEGKTRFDLVYGYVTLQGYDVTVGVQKGTGSLYTDFSCWGYNLPEGL